MASDRKIRALRRAWLDATLLALDCQQVVGRRLFRLARGDADASREVRRMFGEKAIAAVAAQQAAFFALPYGPAAAAGRAFDIYRGMVSANLRRLSRHGR